MSARKRSGKKSSKLSSAKSDKGDTDDILIAQFTSELQAKMNNPKKGCKAKSKLSQPASSHSSRNKSYKSNLDSDDSDDVLDGGSSEDEVDSEDGNPDSVDDDFIFHPSGADKTADLDERGSCSNESEIDEKTFKRQKLSTDGVAGQSVAQISKKDISLITKGKKKEVLKSVKDLNREAHAVEEIAESNTEYVSS